MQPGLLGLRRRLLRCDVQHIRSAAAHVAIRALHQRALIEKHPRIHRLQIRKLLLGRAIRSAAYQRILRITALVHLHRLRRKQRRLVPVDVLQRILRLIARQHLRSRRLVLALPPLLTRKRPLFILITQERQSQRSLIPRAQIHPLGDDRGGRSRRSSTLGGPRRSSRHRRDRGGRRRYNSSRRHSHLGIQNPQQLLNVLVLEHRRIGLDRPLRQELRYRGVRGGSQQGLRTLRTQEVSRIQFRGAWLTAQGIF